ncbi:PAS domain-containing sensor histidine kinase [Caenimonas sp. DR4.4]|uniref:histidine kinase n=1 Tax=Caenimonas aquaedulcis TaxID=2793270 RepID=A0A931MGZ4_9BURK|nr:PAS domain-containing sensor histidine kinase [Caenimonas aquaedulcis]
MQDAACGLAQTDGEGVFLWANRTLCHWVGYEPGELAGRKKLQELFTMGGRIFHQTHWQPLLQMQGSVSEVKLELVPKVGPGIPMVMNAIRRDRGGGGWVHEIALYVARDRDKYERELVSSRRKLEDAVTEAKRLQAEAKDRALFAEQMVGIVSHDLRNPLSTIQMGAVLLSRGEVTPNQLNVLGRVTRATERANRLIADLLDFTQARVGNGLSVTRKPVLPHRIAADSVDELTLAFPDRQLRHAQEGEGECLADPDRLAQMIGNLVANAMAYGQPGTPVTVTSRVDEREFTLAVHNLGPEIPQSLRPELFKPMSRGDEAGAQRSVGLGLYIVNEIAKAHGGVMAVESTAQAGTTFSARLPRQ